MKPKYKKIAPGTFKLFGRLRALKSIKQYKAKFDPMNPCILWQSGAPKMIRLSISSRKVNMSIDLTFKQAEGVAACLLGAIESPKRASKSVKVIETADFQRLKVARCRRHVASAR